MLQTFLFFGSIVVIGLAIALIVMAATGGFGPTTNECILAGQETVLVDGAKTCKAPCKAGEARDPKTHECVVCGGDVVDKYCVASCGAGVLRDKSTGQCFASCLAGNEMLLNGSCSMACSGSIRREGKCVPGETACKAEEDTVLGNNCVPKCAADEVRDDSTKLCGKQRQCVVNDEYYEINGIEQCMCPPLSVKGQTHKVCTRENVGEAMTGWTDAEDWNFDNFGSSGSIKTLFGIAVVPLVAAAVRHFVHQTITGKKSEPGAGLLERLVGARTAEKTWKKGAKLQTEAEAKIRKELQKKYPDDPEKVDEIMKHGGASMFEKLGNYIDAFKKTATNALDKVTDTAKDVTGTTSKAVTSLAGDGKKALEKTAESVVAGEKALEKTVASVVADGAKTAAAEDKTRTPITRASSFIGGTKDN